MAVRAFSFYGENGIATTPRRFIVDATTTAGAPCVRSTATTAGEVVLAASTTSAVDFLGVFVESITYSTTKADFDGFVQGEEGTVMVDVDPFAVWAFRASGGSTAGTALNSTSPANIVTNTLASTVGTLVTAGEVGGAGATKLGGLLIGYTGNNAGQRRRITTYTADTSMAVTVPFPFTIAAGDKFLSFPWSKAGQKMQFTGTPFTEADATIAVGAGADFAIFDIVADIVTTESYVQVIARDHNYNPLS